MVSLMAFSLFHHLGFLASQPLGSSASASSSRSSTSSSTSRFKPKELMSGLELPVQEGLVPTKQHVGGRGLQVEDSATDVVVPTQDTASHPSHILYGRTLLSLVAPAAWRGTGRTRSSP